MMEAKILQRPVGQGGLCEGEVSAGGRPIRWVYDCGSNQTHSLVRELGKLGGDLDLLFLSHLDADHVNGVDRLMVRVAVAEVVLPYLNDEERLLVVAQAVADGTLTGQFAEFMEDMSGWLRGRGAQRVTFVGGPPDEGGDGVDGPVPELPRKDDGVEVDGDLKAVWEGRVELVPHLAEETRYAYAGAFVSVRGNAGRQMADWAFLPFAHPPSKALTAAFMAKVAVLFPGMAADEVVQQVWEPGGREDLHTCYDEIWRSDHNLVSMSLYTGPVRQRHWKQVLQFGQRRQSHTFATPGWLATGDADLSGVRRRRAFQCYYRDVVHLVSVLVVPHHGAATSWHPDVLTGLSALQLGCAAAGPNTYGHPHPSVMSDVLAHPGAYFWPVDDQPNTVLTLEAWT